MQPQECSWYLVRLVDGGAAIISCEDLSDYSANGTVASVVLLTYKNAFLAEMELARQPAYMSATCRIKAGESDGVG
jgi:hypothetical protein